MASGGGGGGGPLAEPPVFPLFLRPFPVPLPLTRAVSIVANVGFGGRPAPAGITELSVANPLIRSLNRRAVIESSRLEGGNGMG